MEDALTNEQLLLLKQHDTFDEYGLDLSCITLLDDIVDHCSDDLDLLLGRIQREKVQLVDQKKRNTNCYQMLCVLDIVIEHFDKPLDEDASELSFYRRFATLLDHVFWNLDIKMQDGETASDAMEHNQNVYGYDATNTFGRKIDLLLKMETGMIELSSNEWKCRKTAHMVKRQRSKNLMSNCAILSKLYLESGAEVNQLMAMDFVGMNGYLYLLQFKNGLFVPSVLSKIFLPTDISHLGLFKESVKALFMWKEFLADVVKKLKKKILVKQLEKNLDDMVYGPSSHCTEQIPSPPLVFFTPKQNRVKKRKLISLED
ncbi:unnamed protein product [Absidia cylindrospora]